MASAETARLIASLELKDQFSKTVNKALTGLTTLDSRIDKTRTKAFQAGQHIGIGIQNVARITAGTLVAGAGIVTASLKLAGDFEAQLNTINTIARATPAQLSAIGDGVRKIAKDTGTGLADLTQGYYDLLSAGIKVSEAQGVLTQANTLAIGGLSTTAEAVDLLTTALNVYGGGAQAAAKDADIFAKTIERGKITAADLAASFSQVGSIAKSSGIELTELGAAYARLTAGGTDAAEASTQIRSAIVALTKQTVPLEKLQKQTGRNYLAIAGKQGLVAALEIMRKDAAKAGVPLIDLLGRVEGLNFVLATTGPNFAAYNADLEAMGQATGTAAAQMAERQKGLNFQLTILKAKLKDAGITIGSALLPKLTPLVAKLNDFVNLNTDKISKFGDSLAGLFTEDNITQGVDAIKGAFQIAKDAAPAIANAARVTGAALKLAVDAFTALPKEIQSLAIAGLAVNKLTGGLVTNLAGSLIGSVVTKLFSALRSAVVNVQGATVLVTGPQLTGPGTVIPLGPGAAAGGVSRLGQAASLISKVFVVGMVAEVADLIHGAISPGGGLEGRTQTGELLPADQLQWPFGPKNTPKIDIGPFHNLFGGDSAFATPVPTPTNLDRGSRFETERPAGFRQKDDIVQLVQLTKATNSYLNDIYRQAVSGLTIRGQKPGELRQAVKDALAVVTKRGNATATGKVLVNLKDQLLHTTDPTTRKILKDAIAQVEHKLVGRQLVQKQLDKAEDIFKGTKSTKEKIVALTAIEKGLAHTSKTGQEKVRAEIAALKKSQKYEARATTEAIKDKDLSVTVTNKNTVSVSLREFGASRTTYLRVGNLSTRSQFGIS